MEERRKRALSTSEPCSSHLRLLHHRPPFFHLQPPSICRSPPILHRRLSFFESPKNAALRTGASVVPRHRTSLFSSFSFLVFIFVLILLHLRLCIFAISDSALCPLRTRSESKARPLLAAPKARTFCKRVRPRVCVNKRARSQRCMQTRSQNLSFSLPGPTCSPFGLLRYGKISTRSHLGT